MALTVQAVTPKSETQFVAGNKDFKHFTITFDSSYPTAGEPLTAADLGCKVVFAVIPCGSFRNTAGTLGIQVSYDHTNAKLLAYWTGAVVSTALAEVASTTDLSTYSGRVLVIGR